VFEDGALGKKVKESGFKMRMVDGRHLVDAVWARDFFTLWNALKRLMIPLYLQNAKTAVGFSFAVLFLLFMQFPLLAYSAIFLNIETSSSVLFVIAAIASVLVYTGGILDAAKGVGSGIKYSLFAPIGCFIVVCGFFAGCLNQASKKTPNYNKASYRCK
jgi:hypothetical protein